MTQWPEPGRLWIGCAPRTWRLTSELWCDLATAELGGLQKPALEIGLPDLDIEGVDDTMYLPPVVKPLVSDRNRLAMELVSVGVPVLMQVVPGDTVPDGATAVYDLLGSLLAGEPERLAKLPQGANAVWPMIPGISDYPEVWDEGLDYLEAVGVECVQPILLDLSPVARRKLAEGRSEGSFRRSFPYQAGWPPAAGIRLAGLGARFSCFPPAARGARRPAAGAIESQDRRATSLGRRNLAAPRTAGGTGPGAAQGRTGRRVDQS